MSHNIGDAPARQRVKRHIVDAALCAGWRHGARVLLVDNRTRCSRVSRSVGVSSRVSKIAANARSVFAFIAWAEARSSGWLLRLSVAVIAFLSHSASVLIMPRAIPAWLLMQMRVCVLHNHV